MLKSIKIIALESQTKDGNKYIKFKGIATNGKLVRFKFTRDCENQIKKEGKYIVDIESENISKSMDFYGDVYWVSKIESYKPYDMDTEKPQNEEDLPF